MREDTSTDPFTLTWPRSIISSVSDSWVGSFARASTEAALDTTRSSTRVPSSFGSPCWAMTCLDTISITEVDGEICAITPSRVTKPRASMVTDEVITIFWSRSTSMTSVSTVPTLISFSSAVLYLARRRDSDASRAP